MKEYYELPDLIGPALIQRASGYLSGQARLCPYGRWKRVRRYRIHGRSDGRRRQSHIVVDGIVRDRVGLKEMQLPVFSKGYMQRGPKKVGPGRINVSIQCAGATVNLGDLVLGDANGVTVVPQERLEEVLERAEEKNNYEINRRKVIAEYVTCRDSGQPLPQLSPKWVTDMLEQG